MLSFAQTSLGVDAMALGVVSSREQRIQVHCAGSSEDPRNHRSIVLGGRRSTLVIVNRPADRKTRILHLNMPSLF